jgi:hypothetical protein
MQFGIHREVAFATSLEFCVFFGGRPGDSHFTGSTVERAPNNNCPVAARKGQSHIIDVGNGVGAEWCLDNVLSKINMSPRGRYRTLNAAGFVLVELSTTTQITGLSLCAGNCRCEDNSKAKL